MADDEKPLTGDEIKELRKLAEKGKQLLEMETNYAFYGRFGRLVWKIGVTATATVAAIAAFKDQLISLFRWG